MNKNQKALMVVENTSSNIEIKKDENKRYVFEGIFAEFGKKNNNGRIYEEDEYMPHLELLQKQIKEGKITLLGELDHPKEFESTFERASHIIEKLEYLPNKRQVWGRIRLLNTPKGKLAQSLVDDGVVLNVSSRAAGSVNEGGIVSIKRIFTWDLVANPGFQNAQMYSVNENYGFSQDDEVQLFETNYNIDDLTKLSTHNENKKINDMVGSNGEVHSLVENLLMKKGIVTEAELEEYSNEVNKNYNSILEEIEDLKTQIKKHDIYNNYMGLTVTEVEERLANIKDDSETQIVSDLMEKIELLEERLLDVEEHNEYLVEKLKTIGKHQDEIVETQQQNNLEFGKEIDSLNENRIKTAEYFEKIQTKHNELVETFGNFVEYNDKLVETINGRNKLQDEVYETINARNVYQSRVNKTLEYRINNGIQNPEKLQESENLNESLNEIKIVKSAKDAQTLLEKVDLLIESVNKQTTSNQVVELNSPAINLLSKENLNYFLSLNENQKQMILEDIKTKKPFTEREVVGIIKENLSPKDETKFEEVLIANIPSSMKSTWDKLSKENQNMYLLEAQHYNLNTPDLMENFWLSRTSLTNKSQLELIKESFDPMEEDTRINSGLLPQSYEEQLKAQLSRYRGV